jgi:hypothetical protein
VQVGDVGAEQPAVLGQEVGLGRLDQGAGAIEIEDDVG